MINKLILLLLLPFCSCNERISNSNISKNTSEREYALLKYISFTEYNASVPANFDLHNFKSIDADKDSIYLKKHTYKKGVHSKTIVLKSLANKTANVEFLNLIAKENSLNNQTLGQLGDVYDGGGIKVYFITNKNDTISFKMSYDINTISPHLQYILAYYDSIKLGKTK